MIASATPFRFPLHDHSPVLRRVAARLLRAPMERLLEFPRLNGIYGNIHQTRDDRPFSQKALDALRIGCDVTDGELARIPTSGPLIVVANHPFGGLDGLVLTSLLQRVRRDVKVLANHFLHAIPDLRDTFIFVDPYGGLDAVARNIGAMKSALRWLGGGGVLAMFPAGEVSHFDFHTRAVVDPRWSEMIGRIVQQTRAPVLPVFFEGQNSPAFQWLGMIHPLVRTAMLPRELLNKCGTAVTVRVGNVIPAKRLSQFAGSAELVAYLRVRTYILRGRGGRATAPNPHADLRRVDDLADAQDPSLLAQEVSKIPPAQQLAATGELICLRAAAAQIPTTLREIGMLRERTFRLVGEGTGAPLDLDRFDDHYLHLFVWNSRTRQIVGAYRLGLADDILDRFGIAGLYTSTLFHFRRQLLDQIGPAIELGRSFVRSEYQKEYAPLALLWKGIAAFVALNPKYKMLFGPVSISNEYRSMTRQLLMSFLRMNRYLPSLARLIRPRNAPRIALDWDPKVMGTIIRDIDEVDGLVAEIESERLSVPVLLRQYLKLNARLLGFNVDPNFGDVLDALMLVDLTQVPRAILTRYMGSQATGRFLEFHRKTS